jgi:MFS family permease
LRLPDGFDRDLRFLMASMAFRRVSMGFLQVVRAIYFALLGFSPVEIGLLLSLATFVSALHSIVFGFLSDRFGRKIFFILGGGSSPWARGSAPSGRGRGLGSPSSRAISPTRPTS